MLHAPDHVLLPPGLVVPVADHRATRLDRAGIQEGRRWHNGAAVQRSRHRQHLQDRTRFIGHAHGSIELAGVAVDRAVVGEVVQVHARRRGQRQDVAVMRVHHHDRPVQGSVLVQRFIQDLFNGGLQLAMNGQHQRRAARNIRDLHRAIRIRRNPDLHRIARQQAVVFLFHAKVAAPLVAHEADQVRGQRLLRIVPLRMSVQAPVPVGGLVCPVPPSPARSPSPVAVALPGRNPRGPPAPGSALPPAASAGRPGIRRDHVPAPCPTACAIASGSRAVARSTPIS